MPRYPEHLRGFSYVGYGRYFLTFCTYERRRQFERSERVHLVRDQFLRTSTDQGCEIFAYCFMADHVHMLVEAAREDADLKRFIKSGKQLPATTSSNGGSSRCGNATHMSTSSATRK
jgi:putative transposase